MICFVFNAGVDLSVSKQFAYPPLGFRIDGSMKVDRIIKIDNALVLRHYYLHYRIDYLLFEESEPLQLIRIFNDPHDPYGILSTFPHPLFLEQRQPKPNWYKKQLTSITTYMLHNMHLVCDNVLTTKLTKYQSRYVSTCRRISIDSIRLRCEANCYLSVKELLNDLKRLIAWNQVYRAGSIRSFKYLHTLSKNIDALVASRDLVNRFLEYKMNDFQTLTKHYGQFKTNAINWPIIPTTFRSYEYVTEYVPTPTNRATHIMRRIKSHKVAVECPKDCACTREDDSYLFRYNLLQGCWETNCPNRQRKIECNHTNEYRMRACRNAYIAKHQRKKCRRYGETYGEIYEFLAWGLDLYTRHAIYNCLPEIDIDYNNNKQDNSAARDRFIYKVFIKALNFVDTKGYCLPETCRFIIDNAEQHNEQLSLNELQSSSYQQTDTDWLGSYSSNDSIGNQLFTAKDAYYASILCKNYELCPDKSLFRIHTKGKGAKCVYKRGIKQGSFIVYYFGYIYEPWRWYDRYDFIKYVMKKKKLLNNFIPYFYNIYLYKHSDEPLGYDMLVVDPSRMGNFSSRFSHSCDPNCGTVITVSYGKYYIAMYSFRDIYYGEELTFDYCSMTESNYEHLNSICLCGMKKCRGNYLQLSTTRTLNHLIDNRNCFYERNSQILRSVGPVAEKDLYICHSHNIKYGFLEDMPSWMVRWMAYILYFIANEGEIYKQKLAEYWQRVYLWDATDKQYYRRMKIELYSYTSKIDLMTMRFQNLITSVDKMKFFFSKNNNKQPPIFIEQSRRIVDVLVKEKDSVLNELQEVLIKQKCEEYAKIVQLFMDAIDRQKIVNEFSGQDMYVKTLFLFRLCCLVISHKLLIMYGLTFSNTLLSDVLYLYAFTHTYFSPSEYKNFFSEYITISLNEITGDCSRNDRMETSSKKYATPFVWGQMVSWYKQTIANPEASLSQDRRGTLSLPLLSSLLNTIYPYYKNSRVAFLRSIREKPASSWPTAAGCDISFKNPHKLYGSMMFDSVHNRAKFIGLPRYTLVESCMSIINYPLSVKLQLFKYVYNTLNFISPEDGLYVLSERAGIDPLVNLPQQVRLVQNEGDPKKKVKKIVSY